MPPPESALNFLLNPAVGVADTRPAVEDEVVALFDEFNGGLLRYAQSLGLSPHDAEDVIQETFLALFRHLSGGKPRHDLRGWVFRVTHNLALKSRHARRKIGDRLDLEASGAENCPDPAVGPEARLAELQRQRRLLAVLNALPEQDRHCLCLRAEGLRYREIALVLGVSLGSVANSLARSFARLGRADEA